MAKSASTLAAPPPAPKTVEAKHIEAPAPVTKTEDSLDDKALPISHPTVVPIPTVAHMADVVTCDGCKGWKRLHPRSAMGQCLPNSRYASGPIYTTDLASCSNADPA